MPMQVMTTRPSGRLSLKDRLSRLTFLEACKLLGPTGKSLIQKSANLWDFDLDEDVYLGDDLFRLRFPPAQDDPKKKPIVVTITLMAEARDRLHWNCTHCDVACEHAGAAFSLILEDKVSLGLAAPPEPRV
ncbi:helicase, partial [Singulisphaera rosea]